MENRNAIIAKAESLFLKFGFRSVTMDDITRELGISKKTIYQHFATKDELVETVVRAHMEYELNEAHALMAASTDALDEMFRIAKMYAESIEKISASAIYDLQKYYGKLWEEMTQKQDEFDMACILQNIKRGRKEGHYRKQMNAEIVAKIFTQSTRLVLNEMADQNSRFTRRQLIRELHDYHIRSIATPDGLVVWQTLLKSL